jgi:hypothetical protein
MSLEFLNANRSYDATRRVSWATTATMEWSFLVTAEALKYPRPAIAENEASLLEVFDFHRNQISAAATKLYSYGLKGCYETRRERYVTNDADTHAR